MFLVLEGPDGCGKSDQQNRMVKRIHNLGRPVAKATYPSQGLAGTAARQLLRESLADDPSRSLLMQCAMITDKYAAVPWMCSVSSCGGDVVCSRWADSALVYGVAAGVDETWLRSAQALLPVPDLTILIDVPIDVTMARIEARGQPRDLHEGRAFQERVLVQYRRLVAQNDPHRVVVDGTQSPEAVHEAIWAHVSRLISVKEPDGKV